MRITNYFKSCIPTIKIDTPSNILKKVSFVAIPAIALAANMMMTKVNADRFTDCIDACDRNGRDAHEAAKFLCYVMCWLIAG